MLNRLWCLAALLALVCLCGSMAAADSSGLPSRVLSGVWLNNNYQGTPMKLSEVAESYSLVTVSFATSTATEGAIDFQLGYIMEGYNDHDFKEDIKLLHGRGQKVVLAVGGDTFDIKINSADAAAAFVSSVKTLMETYGFDGVDIGLVEGFQTFQSQFLAPALLQLHTDVPSAIITLSPPIFYVRENTDTMALMAAAKDAIAVVFPQFYGTSGMMGIDGVAHDDGTVDFITTQVPLLVNAGIPPEQVGLGVIADKNVASSGYMTPEKVVEAFNVLAVGAHSSDEWQAETVFSTLRGVKVWTINFDQSNHNALASAVVQNFADIESGKIKPVSSATPGEKVKLRPSTFKLPPRVLTGYWESWGGDRALRLGDVPRQYNLVCVAFAAETSQPGGVKFQLDPSVPGSKEQTFIADIQKLHEQGQKVVLSFGGETNRINITTEEQISNFVANTTELIETYGFDGVDIDIEGSRYFTGAALSNALHQLHSTFGDDLIITLAPETFFLISENDEYVKFILAAKDIITIVNTQYYNSGSMTGIDNQEYHCRPDWTVDFPVALAPVLIERYGLRPDQVGLGFPSVPTAAGSCYMPPEHCVEAFNVLAFGQSTTGTFQPKKTYPTLRGIMTWSINWDRLNGYPFMNVVGPHLEDLNNGKTPSINSGSSTSGSGSGGSNSDSEGSGSSSTPTNGSSSSSQTSSGNWAPSTFKLGSRVLTGYWEHWADEFKKDFPLGEVPKEYNLVCVAFGAATNSLGEVMVPEERTMAGGATFRDDILKLRSRGQKVILSIGGQNGRVTVTTEEAASNFATSMERIIREYGFDGLDIDLESSTLFTADMLEKGLRRLHSVFGDDLIITMAPETLYLYSETQEYVKLIKATSDIITIVNTQYYNSGSMIGINNQLYDCKKEDEQVDFTVSLAPILIERYGLRPDQVGLGFPSVPTAAGSCYMPPEHCVEAFNVLAFGQSTTGTFQPKKTYPTLRGIMTWSINWDRLNGYPFMNVVAPALFQEGSTSSNDSSPSEGEATPSGDNHTTVITPPVVEKKVSPYLPSRVLSGYWKATSAAEGARLGDISADYDLVLVAGAVAAVTPGEVSFTVNLPGYTNEDVKTDIKKLQLRGQKVLLSIGDDVDVAAGAGLVFAESVLSFMQTYGFDGVDVQRSHFVAIRTEDLVKALRHIRREVPTAITTLAAVTSNDWAQASVMKVMLSLRNVLTMVNLQFYQVAPESRTREYTVDYVVDVVRQYASAGVAAHQIALGFESVAGDAAFVAPETIVEAYNTLQKEKAYRTLRGVMVSSINADKSNKDAIVTAVTKNFAAIDGKK